jgi:hypothetical protein
MSEISLELIRYEPVHVPEPPINLGSYLLIVKAKGNLMPSEIFVYKDNPGDKENPYSGDVFQAVANPRQIEELPINKPFYDEVNNEYLPFYRRNQIELYFLSLSELDDFWNQLQIECAKLVDNYKIFDDLENNRILKITGLNQVEELEVKNRRSLITLYSDPATSKDLEDGEIVKPDKSLFGWLPASMNPRSPEGAKYFYNIDKHFSLKVAWEKGLILPYEVHSLELDGYTYPGGDNGIYIINGDGIFWMCFDPDSFADDRNKPKPSINPWPNDYFVGFGSSDPNLIRLHLYL